MDEIFLDRDEQHAMFDENADAHEFDGLLTQ
jgi:hypothetical protein